MINGSLNHRVDFQKYESPNFKVAFQGSRHRLGCGPNLLAMVTGIKTETIYPKNPARDKDFWSNSAVCSYLRSKHITVIPVSRTAVSNKPHAFWALEKLNSNHVLVCNLLCDKNEASWFLFHDEKIWHNFDKHKPKSSSLFLLNHPTQNVFLVWHPKWA